MANRWTDEQLEAITTEGSSVIVSAGAGSGKTAVLTQRVLRKLKEGISIDSLLLLTFTKAAAAEMKERIRGAIRKEPELEKELEKIDGSYITTFDSFALSIVKRYHYLLNISPNVAIMEPSLIMLQKNIIMNQLFEEYYESEQPLFLQMMTDFCLKDDEEIKKGILSIASKLELLDDKKIYLNDYIEYYYNDEKLNQFVTEYLELIFQKREILEGMLDSIEDQISTEYRNQVFQNLKPLFEAKTYEDFKLEYKLPNLPRGLEEDAKKTKDQFASVLKELESLLTYSSIDEMKEDIRKTKDTASVFVSLLTSYFSRLEQFKKNYDQYEFGDIAVYAIQLVKTYPEVALELKNSFHEIMIDEYQDTNDLQETFISYIANNNVYMVGDIKQSIYRFRNANPYIFKRKYDQYQEGITGKKIDLNKNFRSRKEVLEDINLLFNQMMDDVLGGADYPNGHQMIHGNQSYMEEGKTDQNYHMEIMEYPDLKGYSYNTTEVEAFFIANDIQKRIARQDQIFDKDEKILRPATYSDFVILMDRATNFDLYKKIFEYIGIPLALYKDETIHSGYDMDILRNLLVFIKKISLKEYDNQYQYCFMSVARSYLFRYSDEVIFEAITEKKIIETELYQKAFEISSSLREMDNHILLTRVLQDFSVYEKLVTVGDVEKSIIRFEYLFGLADSLTKSGYDVYDFIAYLEQLKDQGEDIRYSLNTDLGNSVKMMTIHKSKGLEYPICYFSGLKSTFNMSDLKERFLFDVNYGMILPVLKQGIASTIIKELVKQTSAREEISEKIRLFYVALTRSKEKLILLLPKKEDVITLDYNTKLHYRSFADMLYSVYPTLETYIKPINLETLGLTKLYRITKEHQQTNFDKGSPFLVKELDIPIKLTSKQHFSKEVFKIATHQEEQNMRYGKSLHQLLEEVDFKNPNYEKMSTFERMKIEAFLKSFLFDPFPMTVYKEYEFYVEETNSYGIIDLILEYETKLILVDYKLKNVVDEAYQKQLQGYYTFLKKKSVKPIKVYLYSLLEGVFTQVEMELL